MLTVDASATEVGAVTFHKFTKEDRSIAYASRTLTRAKQSYSSIERGIGNYLWNLEIS